MNTNDKLNLYANGTGFSLTIMVNQYIQNGKGIIVLSPEDAANLKNENPVDKNQLKLNFEDNEKQENESVE